MKMQVYYSDNDITVSKEKVSISNITFATNNIDSVALHEKPKQWGKCIFILLINFGGMVVFFFIFLFFLLILLKYQLITLELYVAMFESKFTDIFLGIWFIGSFGYAYDKYIKQERWWLVINIFNANKTVDLPGSIDTNEKAKFLVSCIEKAISENSLNSKK